MTSFKFPEIICLRMRTRGSYELRAAIWAKYKMPGAKYKMPAAKIIFIASGGNIEARKRGKCM